MRVRLHMFVVGAQAVKNGVFSRFQRFLGAIFVVNIGSVTKTEAS
jgi:hypothetical protein